MKLFTTSEFSTLGKCYLKEDTELSGGALGSQQGALNFSNTIERPSHTEKPFPAHAGKADKWALNNYSSAVWVVLKICVERNLPELFNLRIVMCCGFGWTTDTFWMVGWFRSTLPENICYSYLDDSDHVKINQLILKLSKWARGKAQLCSTLNVCISVRSQKANGCEPNGVIPSTTAGNCGGSLDNSFRETRVRHGQRRRGRVRCEEDKFKFN